MNKDSSIAELKGVGDKTKELFEKMGVYTLGDILLHFPRTYIQYPKMQLLDDITLKENEIVAICAQIQRTPTVRNTKRMQITLIQLQSNSNSIQLVWYRMPFLKNSLKPGKWYVFYGKVTNKKHVFSMEQPAVFETEKYKEYESNFLPVYSLTKGITNNLMIKTIKTALNYDLLFRDYIPESIRDSNSLCEWNYAIKQIHFPDDMNQLIDARRRFVFDEFFLFILAMQYQKGKQSKFSNSYPIQNNGFLECLFKKLPFPLTGAQRRALDSIYQDISSPFVMQRLLQGDVGSGKTIVAFLIMALMSHNGYQSAIMAPTEVLARQHYESYIDMCKQFELDFPVILITGSMKTSEKKKIYKQILDSPGAMIIGTHTLIQEKIEYQNLSLVITDEQHRFGVKQREVFANKGEHPHILVMSATPIPRTLAIILYGDLDISVIDEVPAKRLPIKNCVVDISYRPKAYSFIQDQINHGKQAYIICPLVEDSESAEGENVIDYKEKILPYFDDSVRIEILHGKMKAEQKNTIMERFSRNEIQILISTTVIEVGVNVPNTTVMMIENADHFGLAQLHQLRGRVGRGDAQSYCIMIDSANSPKSKKRLTILNHSNDGFYIASEDLKLRGPGDFFGIRQSGDLAFQLADIYQDADVMQLASECVNKLLQTDPNLQNEENHDLYEYMKNFIDIKFKQMNL